MATGRIVYDTLDALTVAADATQDLWSLLGTANRRVRLHGFEITSNAVAAAIIQVSLHRITAAGTGGAASTTEELADEDFSAVTAAFRTQDVTTQGTSGGMLMAWQWEQLGPLGHVFTPEMRPIATHSQGFSMRWETATAATVSGWVCWEEI